jgi:nucleoside-diphosphate-sugar epimerase
MRVLVAGYGYVGAELGRRLSESGHDVFALRRTATGPIYGVTPVVADLERPETLNALPRGLEGVVFCAAPSDASDAAYRALYVGGVTHLIDAVRSSRSTPRVLFTSSTAVYAQSGGERVDEDSLAAPHHFTGRRVLEAEDVVRRSGLDAVVLRLAGIYGPGRTALVDRVARGGAHYQVPPRYTNRIHRDDCVGAIEHLLQHPHPDAVYVGVDEDPADERTVYRWLASELGAPEPLAASAPAQTGTRHLTNKQCQSERLRASGYRFRFPSFREGYRPLLAEFAVPGKPR